MACAQSSIAFAEDMAGVRQALAEDRLFDAFRALHDLAKEGNPEAQYELAGFYHYGRVGAADFSKARDWYQRAANQGNVDAMIGLAVMNGKGLGAPADKKTADKWLIIAINSQKLSPDAAAKVASARADLEQDLTPADIAAATAEAQAFTPKPEH
ncbi:MAG TPA: tetratricopeptide repeat protein [Dongiaceae bacterium]|nr:tetratricopeptide repeat protein [Dongiaceae bacterium]